MPELNHMSPEQARAFCGRWLPAWTGNDPEQLAAFYSARTFYLDPGVPEGISGRDALLTYFRKLLAHNPDWVWTHRAGVPIQDGFLNKWHAHIPVGSTAVEVDGVCLVQFDRHGLIHRNEVYFDRSELLQTMAAQRG